MDDKIQLETNAEETSTSKKEWKRLGHFFWTLLIKLVLGFAVTVGIVCVIGLVLMLSLLYPMEFKKTEIAQFQSPDGEYVLYMFQIGEPAWPFGPVEGRFILKEGDKSVAKLNFSVADDGAGLHYSNVPDIVWKEDYVRARVIGSEQKDMWYMLYYSGETDSHMAETVP